MHFVWYEHGQEKKVYGRTDSDGHFRLLAGEHVEGALHVSLHGYGTTSAAIDPVRSGTTGHRMRLGLKDTLEFEVQDADGRELERPQVTFYWNLAGCKLQDYPGPPNGFLATRDGIWWERPSVPFSVRVSAEGYEPGEFGPFDPQDVESPMVLQLVSYPRLRGRVLCKGLPVANATVALRGAPQARTMELERLALYSLPVTTAQTDEDGNYDVMFWRPGTYVVRAWSPTLGLGISDPMALELDTPPLPVNVDLTHAPGSIAGKVLFPAGHGPGELFLSVSNRTAYVVLASDGSFVLPGLAPGPTTVQLRRGSGSSDGPVSTTIVRKAGSQWIYMSHGPGRAPEWLRSEPTYDVQVIPGEQASLTIDLTRASACVLEGQVLVNGKPPRYAPRTRGGWFFAPTPRVILDRGDGVDYVSRAELDEQGRFQLQAALPGTYRLRIEVPVGEDLEWQIMDAVELKQGTTAWTENFTTGSARVYPGDSDWKPFSADAALRWRGPGDLRVFLPWSPADEETGALLYEAVPAGIVQFIVDRSGKREVILEQEIRVGEEATLRRR